VSVIFDTSMEPLESDGFFYIKNINYLLPDPTRKHYNHVKAVTFIPLVRRKHVDVQGAYSKGDSEVCL
jgi:hypothetical protein